MPDAVIVSALEAKMPNIHLLISDGNYRAAATVLATALEAALHESIPTAFRDHSAFLSKTGKIVRIDCDTADDANELFDWMAELPPAQPHEPETN